MFIRSKRYESMNILLILLVSIALLAIAFMGIAIKMFFKRNGSFEKHSCCSTNNSQYKTTCACNTSVSD